MVFKTYRWKLIWRVLLLALTALAIAYAVFQTTWEVTVVAIVLFFFLQITELVWFNERWARNVGNFFSSIEQRDFTGQYDRPPKGKHFTALGLAMQRVNEQFRQLHVEKQGQFLYLQTVFEHVGVGLICFSSDTLEVQLMNQAAVDLLRVPYLPKLEARGHLTRELLDEMALLPSGKRKVVKVAERDTLLHLALAVTDFSLQGETFRLASLQDIKTELDEKEMDSWQKLIRVLTHEIMNSATPISSLSHVIGQKLEEREGVPKDFALIEPKEAANIYKAVLTIEKRSKGLIKFVRDYKNLTKVAPPQFERIEVLSLFQRLGVLLGPELEEKGVKLRARCRPMGLAIVADRTLLEQALINLLKNAIEALEGMDTPQVSLMAKPLDEGGVRLQVADNGIGMAQEMLDQIFVPFYTSKPNGSGIGLSLARQIIYLHKGSIKVSSTPNEGTIFYIDL